MIAMRDDYSFPLIRLNSLAPTPQALNLFPEELSKRYVAVPLRLDRDTLVLATPFVSEDALKRELQVTLRRPVRLFVCTWLDYKTYQARCYGLAYPQANIPETELVKKFLREDSAAEKPEAQSIQPGASINRDETLELIGLSHYLPHFSFGSLLPAKGLEILLPKELPREHFVPLAWVHGTLYSLIDDPQYLATTDLQNEAWDIHCQWIVADKETVNKAYQRSIPHTPTRPNVSDDAVIAALIQDGVLRKEQGDYALQVERQVGGAASRKILFENGVVAANDWLRAYASLVDAIPLTSDDIPDEFERLLARTKDLIPAWIARKYHLLPLVVENNTLLLGVSEIDSRLTDLAAALTHLKVELRLMDLQTIDLWIGKAYGGSVENKGTEPFRLDAILTELGYITGEQYQEALAKSSTSQNSWLDMLSEKGYLQERDLVEALGYFTGNPTLSLDHFILDEKLIRHFPAELLTQFNIFPLFENREELWVATAGPFSIEGFQQFELQSGKAVWPVIVPRSVLLQVIQRYCCPDEEKEQQTQIVRLMDQLVATGTITRKQAFDAQQKYLNAATPLDQAIIHCSNIEPDRLARTLSHILSIGYEDLSLHEETQPVIDALGVSQIRAKAVDPVDYQVAHLVSLETALQLNALPIHALAERVVVAFSDPFFEPARKNLETLLNKPVTPVITGRPMLEEAIHRTLGRPNLGTTLLMAGMITRSQLNDALEYAHRANIRLGRALVFKRYLTEDALYQFLARQAELPFFDLSTATIDEKAARLLDPKLERAYGILPLAADESHVILATIDPHNHEALQRVETALQKPLSLVVVTESDLDAAFENLYRNEYVNESVSSLLERSPHDSAFNVLEPNQIVALIVMGAISVIWLALNALSYLVILNALITAFYLVFSIYKFRLIFRAISSNLEVPVSDQEVAQLKDSELPVYTILVPVHHEAEVLPDVLKSMVALDYPSARLDILVLLEEDDLETIRKFDEINPPHFIQKVIVPNELPKTKPKACNYGLIHARGDYIVIYDAEDLPDRDQLKKVLIAFSKAPEDVACIQAKLNYYNRKQNILTQWFTVEYSMWFDLLLPGLDADHAPIPLGGTSNHFKTYALLEAGAWDPYNVTEDADLGIRLFKRGYRTRIVDSTTYEEANSQYNNWIRQRSRWLKGYMQTWLVHMRHPIRLIQEIGFNNFMSFQYIVGGTFFTALMNPVYWVLTSIWFLAQPDFIHLLFPGMIFYMGALCLYVGTFVFTYINVAGSMRRGYYDMVATALLSPIYWAMSSIASWKGFVQLIFKPHFWEKTRHGLYQKPAEAATDSQGEVKS
jgi:cellulose synthase/poly-beta-1,6-N-acetylglucosamine synthase-like glycosyltransferase